MANFTPYINGLMKHNPLSLVGYNMEIAFGKTYKIYDVNRNIPLMGTTIGNSNANYNSFTITIGAQTSPLKL